MSKRKIFALMATMGVVALLLVSIVSFVTVRNAAHAAATGATTANFAFSGLNTQGLNKGTALIGGLSLQVSSSGAITGNLARSAGVRIPVTGKIDLAGNLTITFSTGQLSLAAQGLLKTANEYVGAFQILSNNKQVGSGIWSALRIPNLSSVLPLSFVSKISQGPSTGVGFSGAIVLDKNTLAGTLLQPDGTIANVLFSGKGALPVNATTLQGLTALLPVNTTSLKGVTALLPVNLSILHGLLALLPTNVNSLKCLIGGLLNVNLGILKCLIGLLPVNVTSLKGLTGLLPLNVTSLKGLTALLPVNTTSLQGILALLPANTHVLQGLLGSLPVKVNSLQSLLAVLPVNVSSLQGLTGTLIGPALGDLGSWTISPLGL